MSVIIFGPYSILLLVCLALNNLSFEPLRITASLPALVVFFVCVFIPILAKVCAFGLRRSKPGNGLDKTGGKMPVQAVFPGFFRGKDQCRLISF
jgi:hypothetical protein